MSVVGTLCPTGPIVLRASTLHPKLPSLPKLLEIVSVGRVHVVIGVVNVRTVMARARGRCEDASYVSGSIL